MITIIVPVYNDEVGIKKTIDSIKKIKRKDIKVIIVNDGSTDKTLDIINNEVKNNNMFTVYSNENHGCSYSRNYGIEKSNTDYITFIDSGDTYLESAFPTNDSFDTDVTIFSYNRIEGNNTIHKHLPFEGVLKEEKIKKDLIPLFLAPLKNDNLDEPIMGAVWRMFFKRDFITNNQILFNPEIAVAEDLLFCLKALVKAKTVRLIDTPIYNYIRQPGTAIEKFREDTWKNSIICEELILQILQPYVSEKYYMLRFKVFQFYQCTWALSNISRSNLSLKTRVSMSTPIFAYFKKNINKSVFNELSLSRKLAYILFKLNLIQTLNIMFYCKEKRRLSKYE